MTDSIASFLILDGALIHSDDDLNSSLFDLRSFLTELDLQLNVVWRRRNTPLMKYADMFSKLVPYQDDKRTPLFRKHIKNFRGFLQCRDQVKIIPILKTGKLLSEISQAAPSILSFPLSATFVDDIFDSLGIVPKNKMLILPVFPSKRYWATLEKSTLSCHFKGPCQSLFPNNPNNVTISLWW